MSIASTRPARLLRVREGAGEEADDALATEEPLEIRVNGEAVAVAMRTPGDDAELVRGFLLTEGLVRAPADVLSLTEVAGAWDKTPGNVWDARVPPEVAAARPWKRNLYATSSCGVCGKASIEMVRALRPRVASALRVRAETLYTLPDRLGDAQPVFGRTGGLHAAALFTTGGELVALREDVGRHNAVDKVVGWAASIGSLPLADALVVVSGRAGFEIVQKAAVAGAPLVAAVGAPSSLAVELAEEAGVTLVGFLRGRGFNLYTHPERVVFGAPPTG